MKSQKVFILIEGGYEDGQVEIIGAFTTRQKVKLAKEKAKEKFDKELDDWVWYEIKEVNIE